MLLVLQIRVYCIILYKNQGGMVVHEYDEVMIIDSVLCRKENDEWIRYTLEELTDKVIGSGCKISDCNPTCEVQCPKIKVLRHMETVRNYLNLICKELLKRGEHHDQSKLGLLEKDFLNPKYDMQYTTYGSNDYNENLKKLNKSLMHHYSTNRHHPEHFKNGIVGMNLIDIVEMFVDWYASVKRHNEGDVYKSIEYNKTRFHYSEEIVTIFKHTADLLGSLEVYHNADES